MGGGKRAIEVLTVATMVGRCNGSYASMAEVLTNTTGIDGDQAEAARGLADLLAFRAAELPADALIALHLASTEGRIALVAELAAARPADLAAWLVRRLCGAAAVAA